MGFGVLSEAQKLAITPFVKGFLVHDLGAGDLQLSEELVRLGAKLVVAIDGKPYRGQAPRNVTPITACFDEYHGLIRTAFVSWPRNTFDFGLVRLIERAHFVLYLGKNSDGSACGFPQFWEVLRAREVLTHVPDRENTLIVYGHKQIQRPIIPEEYAALYQERIWTYEELHRAS